jgi:hypothetical protein
MDRFLLKKLLTKAEIKPESVTRAGISLDNVTKSEIAIVNLKESEIPIDSNFTEHGLLKP